MFKPTLLLLVAVCCFPSPNLAIAQEGDPIVNIDDENKEMNKAIETARKTFPQFLKHWKTMRSDAVSVKVGLPTTNEGLEHIWFEPISITETQITGRCANNPNKIANLKLGDKRTFKISEVSDWMILVGDECYGGYTIRVLAKMQPENAPPIKFVDFKEEP